MHILRLKRWRNKSRNKIAIVRQSRSEFYIVVLFSERFIAKQKVANHSVGWLVIPSQAQSEAVAMDDNKYPKKDREEEEE